MKFKIPDQVIINRVNFASPEDHIKEMNRLDKYLDLVIELIKLWNVIVVTGALGTFTKSLNVTANQGYTRSHPNELFC